MIMNRFRILAAFAAVLCALASFGAETPAQVLDKAVSKMRKAKSVNCSFRLEGNGNNVKGTFRSSGGKFNLATPVSTTWFDGKNMWTANNSTKEITLVNPSASEIKETNPFAYLDGYKAQYVLFFSKRKDAGRYLVLLNPRSSESEVKAIEVAVNRKTYLPERFIIRDRNDKVTTLYVESLTLTAGNPSSTFVCPVGSMKDFELVDLR